MPRKPQPWFRFYVETMSDRKIRRLTPAERWVWPAVLAAARESVEPGRLLIAEDEPMTLDDLADYADVPRRTAASAVEKMRRFGMVHEDDGVMVVTNFSHRQFESDVSTSRTRTHRERSNEQGRNVPTSDIGTVPSRARATETETETDTEKKTSSSLPRKRGNRIPNDWMPGPAEIEWQRTEGISDLLARRELPRFRDYWAAKPGQDGVKLDWPATWRNWLRRAADREPPAKSERPTGWEFG